MAAPPSAAAAAAGLPLRVAACLGTRVEGSSGGVGAVPAAEAVVVAAAGRWHETLRGAGAGAVTPVAGAAGGREP